jgi:hypothetical protein
LRWGPFPCPPLTTLRLPLQKCALAPSPTCHRKSALPATLATGTYTPNTKMGSPGPVEERSSMRPRMKCCSSSTHRSWLSRPRLSCSSARSTSHWCGAFVWKCTAVGGQGEIMGTKHGKDRRARTRGARCFVTSRGCAALGASRAREVANIDAVCRLLVETYSDKRAI